MYVIVFHVSWKHVCFQLISTIPVKLFPSRLPSYFFHSFQVIPLFSSIFSNFFLLINEVFPTTFSSLLPPHFILLLPHHLYQVISSKIITFFFHIYHLIFTILIKFSPSTLTTLLPKIISSSLLKLFQLSQQFLSGHHTYCYYLHIDQVMVIKLYFARAFEV